MGTHFDQGAVKLICDALYKELTRWCDIVESGQDETTSINYEEEEAVLKYGDQVKRFAHYDRGKGQEK